MSPVFLRLHSKRYLMRAAARLLFLRGKMDSIDRKNESTKAVLSFFVLLFPEEFHRAHSGLRAIRDRLCDLEQAAGAVSCGEQPGHGG